MDDYDTAVYYIPVFCFAELLGKQDILREQEMLEEMSRRAKEGDDDERRRLEEEVAKHKVST